MPFSGYFNEFSTDMPVIPVILWVNSFSRLLTDVSPTPMHENDPVAKE